MRSVTSTINDAQNNTHAYDLITRLEVYPTRIFFESLDDNDPYVGADNQGIMDNPSRQDIAHSATVGGLVTFFADGDLKYAVQGNATPVTTSLTSEIKPGVLGDVIYVYTGGDIKRYSIDWSLIGALDTSPFTLQASVTPSKTPVALHALSATECVAICDDDGGFTIIYINGTTQIVSASRFMFPKFVDWDGSSRDMDSLGIFSGAALINSTPFIYMSNAGNGMVQGIYYDPDTQTWSDIFTALPTDLQVSLCEFRIANCYNRHGVIYMVGQLNRTDVYGTAKIYSLILKSTDGKTFSIDNFTLVSNLSYRFLATVGSNDYLYIGNCNRVASKPITWYFDGNDDSTSQMLAVSQDEIKSISDTDVNSISVTLASGKEQFVGGMIQAYSRVKLFTGFKTTAGNEYVLYGTYIIDGSPKVGYRNGSIGFSFSAVSTSVFMLTGLSMPFYAEVLGLSSIYDPMNKVSGKLYAAPNAVKSELKFQVDFWKHTRYTNTDEGITGISLIDNGGVGLHEASGAHKEGIILESEVQQILGLNSNPKITATSINTRIYGWSQTYDSGLPNDAVNLILIHSDEDGNDEQTIITNATNNHWKTTYAWQNSGYDPIELTVTGLTVGRFIKYIGLVFEAPNSTKFVPARVEFISGVEIGISLTSGDIPWEVTADGTFKVPGSGQPFVMFSQRPYNTQNFIIASQFTNNVVGQITGYPVGAGLVGLAEDAGNCIVARYDTTSSKVQLIKLRNGVETIIAQQAIGFSVGDSQKMEFKHKDGKFDIYMLNESSDHFELVLSYNWKASDGFMFTSRTGTMKCGIYGLISAPMCRLLAFAKGDTETNTTEGLPIDPLADISDFPSTGRLLIGDNVYSYSGKISHPSYVRGPYQLRATGIYPYPFGNGSAGVEVRDFDWFGDASGMIGKLIAIDTGDSYLCNGAEWRVFTRNSGVIQYLVNRARYYASNRALASSFKFSLTNRVWVVGGFSGVSISEGDPIRHSVGEYAILNLEGEIKCHWFMGSGGESDTTVEDLIDKICNLSGAKANFPGDYTLSSLTVLGEDEIFQDDYAEGFDLSFELDAPGSFEIRTNVKVLPDNYEERDDILLDTGTKLVITDLGSGNYTFDFVSTPSNTVMFSHTYTSGALYQRFRVLFYGNNVSLHQNGRWVTTVTLDKLVYTQTSYIRVAAWVDDGLYSTGSIDFKNIRVKDLGDWREAVYIDLETDGNAAIGSVVQERPVEIVSQPDGSLNFFYEYTRQEITSLIPPHSHEYQEVEPKEAGSDAIVYGAGDVQTIQYERFARTMGLATRLIRIPNLDIGAMEAAQRMLDRFYESRGRHSISLRPNLKIQPGDKLTFSYDVYGDTRTYTIIVESVGLNVVMADKKTATMNISGRNVLA